MRISISYFPMVRYFLPNQIGISTAVFKPHYWSYGLTKRGSFQGIEEKSLSPYYVEQYCSKECPYKKDLPNCPFLTAYRNYLDTVNINYLLSEFKRIAEDVKKINNYSTTMQKNNDKNFTKQNAIPHTTNANINNIQ